MTASLLSPLAMAVATLEIAAADGVVAVEVATMGPSSSSLVMATQRSGRVTETKRGRERERRLIVQTVLLTFKSAHKEAAHGSE